MMRQIMPIKRSPISEEMGVLNFQTLFVENLKKNDKNLR